MLLRSKPIIFFSTIMLSGLLIFTYTVTTSCYKSGYKDSDDSSLRIMQPWAEYAHNVSIQYAHNDPSSPDTTKPTTPNENFYGDSILVINHYGFESFFDATAILRFEEIGDIYQTKHVGYAILYLYGVDSPGFNRSTAPGLLGNSAYPGSAYGQGNNAITLQRLTSAWDEKTVTWNTQPAATDSGSVVIAPSNKRWGYNVAIDVTAMVKYWVANPDRDFGFRLVYPLPSPFTSGHQQMLFYSSNAANTDVRPKLVVCYK